MKKLLLVLLLSGCSSFAVNTKLPLPVRPVLPKIQAQELECLSDQTFFKLRDRDVLWENHVDKLESIIRATH